MKMTPFATCSVLVLIASLWFALPIEPSSRAVQADDLFGGSDTAPDEIFGGDGLDDTPAADDLASDPPAVDDLFDAPGDSAPVDQEPSDDLGSDSPAVDDLFDVPGDAALDDQPPSDDLASDEPAADILDLPADAGDDPLAAKAEMGLFDAPASNDRPELDAGDAPVSDELFASDADVARADLFSDGNSTKAANKSEIRIFALKYVPVSDAAKALTSVFGSDLDSITVFSASNKLILRGKRASIEESSALLRELDRESPEQATAIFGAMNSPNFNNPNTVDTADLTAQAEQMAVQYRDLVKRLGKNHPDVVKLRAFLTDTVTETYDQTLRSNTKRIETLEKQLETLKKRLSERENEKVRNRAIEERIEQLISQRRSAVQQRPAGVPTSALSPNSFVPTSVAARNPTGQFSAIPLPQNVVSTSIARAPIIQDDSPLGLVAAHIESQAAIDRAAAEIVRAQQALKQVEFEFSRAANANLKNAISQQLTRRTAELKSAKSTLDTANRLQALLKTRLRAQRDVMQNDLEQSRLKLATADREMKRAEQLSKQAPGAISQSELDQLRTKLDQVQLELDRSQGSLEIFLREANPILKN